jgi:hypothetical protein
LLLDVSLTMSCNTYAVPVAQLPLYAPSESTACGLPVELNDKNLLARVVLTGNVMSIDVGSVTGALIERSAVSATC